MLLRILTATILLVGTGYAVADEKDSKPGTQSGPPPSKGWRKNEVAPVPPPKAAPAPKTAPAPKYAPMAVKPPAPKAAAPQKPDGIGTQVSAWAKSGIHGRELAAKIHQLQATLAKQPATPQPTVKPKKGQPEIAPPPPVNPKKPKKDGKKGKDDEQG